MPKTSEKKGSKDYDMVSFRLAANYYAELEKLAESQRDPKSGTLLSPSQVARDIVIEALERLSKKKS